MKQLLVLTFLLALASNGIAQRNEFVQFEAYAAPFNEWFQGELPNKNAYDTISIDAFEMGNLITWKQYKEFLADVKRMKGTYTYEQLLPKLPQNHLNSCLTTKKFDSSPVVGVSWSNAHEYCKWRIVIDSDGQLCWEGTQDIYRLPTQLEWISAYLQSNQSKFKIDLKTDYSDWTTTSYDESMYFLKDYQYDAKKMDPPSMKRKRTMGSSFFVPAANVTNNNFGYYQDSSYAHIGFRLVREKNEYADLGELDDYLGDHYQDFCCEYAPYSKQETMSSDEFHAEYYKAYDRMTWQYESFYPNGQQKSKGLFYNNQRLGIWTIWDTLGNKILERNYLSPYRFEQTYPKIKDEQASILRDAQIIELSRNSEGLMNYPYVQERSVFWSKRLWTRIEPEGNDQFFRKNRLIDAIKLGVELGNIRLFDTNSDEFRDTISKNEFTKRLSSQVVAFAMKEDFFYDVDRGIASTRPIGICPIVVDTINGTAVEREIAWIYFPDLRSTLGTIQCFSTTDLIKAIHKYDRGGTSPKTLDDLFFFRDFNRKIVGTAHYKGKTTIPSEASQYEDILLIEKEHDSWIELNSSSSSY